MDEAVIRIELHDAGASGGGSGSSGTGGGAPTFTWPPYPTFVWPPYPTFVWPALPVLPPFPKFTWPPYPPFPAWTTPGGFKWPPYPKFIWPPYPAFTWPPLPAWAPYPAFTWPPLPRFRWPAYPPPPPGGWPGGGAGRWGGGSMNLGSLGLFFGVGSPLAVVMKIREVLDSFYEGTKKAVRGIADFSVALVDPHADPSIYIDRMGNSLESIGRVIFRFIHPVVGLFVGAMGEAISGLARFMRAIDGMVDRYAQYSPTIAVAQAMGEVTQILNDIRRSREAGPQLARYVQVRTELQQKIEDAKLRFMIKALPLAVGMMSAVEKVLPLIEQVVDMLVTVASKIPWIADDVDKIRRELNMLTLPEELKDFDPLEILKAGFLQPGQALGEGGRKGVMTPAGRGVEAGRFD